MNWLKNVWYVAGFSRELDGGQVVDRRFLDTPVVMLRHSDGRVAALEDLCPHRLMPLSAGTRVGDELQCGYHGMRFRIDGLCTLAPGQTHMPSQACVRSFPLSEKHGLLWIWLGDAGRADVDLIPDIRWNDHPDWTPSRGYHHVKANFRLAVDNLMDLGHESWVHLRTIGQGHEECIPNYPVKVSIEGEGLLKAHREMPDIDAPPFFAMVLNHSGPINRWQTAISLAPSICMTDFGVYPVGTSADDAYRSHVCHLLTPETEESSHYFWSVARNKRLDDETLTQDVCEAITQTFDEDTEVLEIQQAQIKKLGGAVPRVALKVDEAPIRTRRLLDALIKREQEDPTFVYRPALMVDDATPALQMELTRR
ncbi:aromatic ring-hydroxylating dioxygenase subunit alpha [Paraburkholderia bannensis]|uniref:aromatic ring-hydroxylating dioxygenase subunit alpha n=1 Tax=Paraburkholderia bannensis TaxID=765414 RepID=UPI002AAF499B|nr:aromatic ring-hydroxylating dioxygenase subunit alpha [Paraburkholderia bannensis]